MFELSYWFYRAGIESILHDTNAVTAARSTAQLPRDMSANGTASATPGPSLRRRYHIIFNIGP